jgi:hypothetical protein
MYKKPLPEGLEIVQREDEEGALRPAVLVKEKNGRRVLRFLTEDGTSVLVPRSKLYIAYEDGSGKRKVVAGFKDKTATEELAQKLERDAERAQVGLSSGDRKRQQAPLQEAVDLHLDDLERRGSKKEEIHCRETKRLLNTVVKQCGWPNLASIRPRPIDPLPE